MNHAKRSADRLGATRLWWLSSAIRRASSSSGLLGLGDAAVIPPSVIPPSSVGGTLDVSAVVLHQAEKALDVWVGRARLVQATSKSRHRCEVSGGLIADAPEHVVVFGLVGRSNHDPESQLWINVIVECSSILNPTDGSLSSSSAVGPVPARIARSRSRFRIA